MIAAICVRFVEARPSEMCRLPIVTSVCYRAANSRGRLAEMGRRLSDEGMKIEWLKLSEQRTIVLAIPNRQNSATSSHSRLLFSVIHGRFVS